MVAAGGVFIYHHFLRDLPDFTSVKEFRPPVITQVFARDGQRIGEFYSERRIEVPYSRLPRHLVLAFVAAEDARPFEHPGVDITGIARAFFRNLEAGESGPGRQHHHPAGGEAHPADFGEELRPENSRSGAGLPDRQLHDQGRDSHRLSESHLPGLDGAYGVEAAAQEYFLKHVEDLSLAEASILAGIPKAPSRYDPYLNPRRAKERQAYVLKRMAEVGFISKEQEEAAFR